MTVGGRWGLGFTSLYLRFRISGSGRPEQGNPRPEPGRGFFGDEMNPKRVYGSYAFNGPNFRVHFVPKVSVFRTSLQHKARRGLVG